MLRPTPLRRYLSVMKARGVDADTLLAGTGLDAAQLEQPNGSIGGLIGADQYQQIIENMVRLGGDEGLGLDVGLERDVKDFGILGYAALTCRTVRHSVEEFWGGPGGYGEAMGMIARVVIPRSGSATVTMDIAAPAGSPPVHRFLVEEALCLLLKVGAQVAGAEPRFIRLELSYPRPAYAARYRELFRCPVLFGRERTRLSLARSWFEMPLPSSDPELIEMYQQRLSAMRKEIAQQQPLAAQLRSLFVRRRAVPALDAAARELGLSPRTLRRQLQQQRQSYRRLATDFRLSRALELLRSGTAAAKQISEEAGFADVNAFRRAFKAWTGKTVREYAGR